MKAITYHRYGGPEVLKIEDVPQPSQGPDEVLIRVQAFSINPYDWHYMRGRPIFMRLMSGPLKPKRSILGNDVAGIVEEVGSKVTEFKKGDRVFGSAKLGGFAEYAAIREDRLVHVPMNMSMADASGMIIAGVTALETIDRVAKVKQGQTVLINGASGGVGHYTVQIAKAYGATVTGVCSSKNVEMVKQLGADEVIDYTQEKLDNGKSYDVVIDVVGNLHPKIYSKLTKQGGMVAVVGFQGMKRLLHVMFRSSFGKPKVQVVQIDETADSLRKLNQLFEKGELKTHIDRTYAFHQTSEAIDYLEQGHARGKVVINLNVD